MTVKRTIKKQPASKPRTTRAERKKVYGAVTAIAKRKLGVK